jgi:HK97 family phage portal protein
MISFRSIFDFFTRSRVTKQRPGDSVGGFLFGGESFAGTVVSEENALSLPAFLAGVRLISSSMAMAEIDVFNGPSERGSREIENPVRDCLNGMANPWAPAFTVRQALNAKRLIHGNAYAEIVFQSDGTIQLWPLCSPDYLVTPHFDDAGNLKYRVSGFGSLADLPPEKVLHLRGFSVNGFTGLSLLGYCRETLGLSRAMDEYVGRTFKNGSRPGGYLKFPGALGEEAWQRMLQQWEKRHSGSGNAGRLAILEEGGEWRDNGMNSDDMQLLESRQLSVEDFARVLGIPLSKLRVKNANAFSNAEEDNIDYVTNSLMPLMIADEQEITYKLLAKPFTCKHDTERLLTVNTQTRDASFGALRRLGVYNIDDIRRRLRLPPLPDGAGQTHLQEVNLAPVAAPVQPTDQGAVAPVADGGALPVEDVQATALNGAQVTSLLEIVTQASQGLITIETAKALVAAAFPLMPQSQIDSIFAKMIVITQAG